MKSWQSGPDNVLADAVKMSALMSFCFGVGLLASSIIGVGVETQLAQVTGNDVGASYTSTGSAGNGEDTNIPLTQITNTPDTSGTTIPGTATSPSAVISSLNFTSAVPSIVASDFSVVLNVVAVNRPKLVVRGLNVNKLVVLEPTSQQLPTVNFLARFRELPPGRYELIAKGFLPSTETSIEVMGPRFEILAPVTAMSGPTPTPTTGTSAGTALATSTVTNPGAVTVASTTINNPVPVSDPIEGEATVPELKLIIPNQTIYKGFVPAQVRMSVSLPEAFIYLQSPNLSTPRFVGKARYYDNSTLLLMIDTNQLPSGEHRIYASAKFSDLNVESEKKRFFIDNSSATIALVLNPGAGTTTNPNLITQPTKLTKPDIEEPVTIQPASINVTPKIQPKEEVEMTNKDDNRNSPVKKEPTSTLNSSNNSDSVSLSDTLKTLIPQLLKENEQEINQRLKIFGEDLHKKDANVNELRKKVEDDLMVTLLDDYRLRSLSSEAQKRLRAEVKRLVNKAEKVELLIIKAEVSSAGLDEVMKTFSQSVVPAEDALVDTSSPREFGLVREDILKIESVSPILSSDTNSTTTKIYTEIKGRALPKSLVTLYIYSTPVMVTVRADEDGTFLYVYEKDLDDGDHEVYVALTTTEGDIVVKSPVFQFFREAQAFSSPDSGNGDSLVPATAGTPLTKDPYFIVISITLLVVSFIFFLLGFHSVKRLGRNRVV